MKTTLRTAYQRISSQYGRCLCCQKGSRGFLVFRVERQRKATVGATLRNRDIEVRQTPRRHFRVHLDLEPAIMTRNIPSAPSSMLHSGHWYSCREHCYAIFGHACCFEAEPHEEEVASNAAFAHKQNSKSLLLARVVDPTGPGQSVSATRGGNHLSRTQYPGTSNEALCVCVRHQLTWSVARCAALDRYIGPSPSFSY